MINNESNVPNGLLHNGMYNRGVEGPGFQEQFWPQPILDTSITGLGQNPNPAGSENNNGFSNGSANGGANGGTNGGANSRIGTGGSTMGPGGVRAVSNNNYYGFMNNGNRSLGYNSSNQTLGIADSMSDPPSPRNGVLNNTQVKKRVAKACDHCRKRKIKCGEISAETRKCANCLKYGVACNFSRTRDDAERKRRGGEDCLPGVHVDNTNPTKFTIPLDYNIEIPNSQVGSSSEELMIAAERKVENSGKMTNRVEKLDRKVSLVIEKVSKMEAVMEKYFTTHKDPPEENFSSKPRSKQYSTTLLTVQKLIWLKNKTSPNESYQQFLGPIRDLMAISMKWYFTQMKITVDFSSPMLKNNSYSLYPIPPRAQSKRIVENFQEAIITASAPGFQGLDYYGALVDKFYDLGEASLSYAELLLLNTIICSGASRMRQMTLNDFYRFRKDNYNPNKTELKSIENDTFLNAIFCYNKVVIGNGGVIEIQALLLLTFYLQENLNTDLATTVLSTAIRFALDNELNRVPPPNISIQEEAMRRSLWWYCYNRDSKYSLLLSRPSMLRHGESHILTDEQYYIFTKKILYDRYPQLKNEIDEIRDFNNVLDYAVNFSDLIPYFMSYYIQKLGKIEARIANFCFSFDTLKNYSFDQVIDNLLEIRTDLIEWGSSLHPSMRLESYKKYISLLYLPNNIEDPGLNYDFISSRVLIIQIRFYHLRNLLSMYATSFLVDNVDQFRASHHKVLTYHIAFEEECLESCVKILEVFQNVDYDLHMYNESLYNLLTAIFSLFLYVSEHIDSTENKRVVPIIELLIKDHELLIGTNEEYLVSENVKWNISLFFYTFLLSKTISAFNSKNKQAANFNFVSAPYGPMLVKILKQMDLLKNDALDRLEFLMKNYSFDNDIHQPLSGEENLLIELSPLPKATSANKYASPIPFLRSDKNFKVANRRALDLNNWSKDNDKSLFPVNNKSLIEGTTSSLSNSKTNTDLNSDKNDKLHFLNKKVFGNEPAEGLENLLEEFQDFFCQNEFFFDRDLKFTKAFRDQVFCTS